MMVQRFFMVVLVLILQESCVKSAKWGWYPLDGGNNQLNENLGVPGDAVIRDYPTVPFVQYQADSTPSPRVVSNQVGDVECPMTSLSVRKTTVLMEAWGQFIHNDIVKVQRGNQSWPISVPRCDPIYDTGCVGNVHIKFARSNIVNNLPVNEVTTWLDGSNIYGSTLEVTNVLRSKKGGLMRVSKTQTRFGELPPLVNELNRDEATIVNMQNFNVREINGQMFVCGDRQCNQNPLLLSMNILFLREHNRVARLLAKAHPLWDDTKLFHRARRYIIAEIQKVTLEEYFYWLLGGRTFPEDVCTTYDPTVDPRINVFYAAATAKFGHSQISKFFTLMNSLRNGFTADFALDQLYFEPAFFKNFSVSTLWAGMASFNTPPVDTQYADSVRNNLFKTRNKKNGFDLFSIDIQRTRDLGIPPYQQMLTIFHLPSVPKWADFNMNCQGPVSTYLRDQFSSLYISPSSADALVSGLAEAKVVNDQTLAQSDYSSLGTLFEASFISQWKRLITGDRFWYCRNLKLIEDPSLPQLSTRSLAVIMRNNFDQSNVTIPDNVWRTGPASTVTNVPFTQPNASATIPTVGVPEVTAPFKVTTLATGTAIPQPVAQGQNWVNTKRGLKGGCAGANGFPASPRTIIPFSFPFVDPPFAPPRSNMSATLNGLKVEYHEIDIVNQPIQIFRPGTASEFFTYKLPEAAAGTTPGPTIEVCKGVMTIVRFKNFLEGRDNRFLSISAQKPYLGNRGPGPDVCSAGFANPWPVSIHHHGSASIAPWDGWADDLTFSGCGKNYIYPNNRASTTWYHDHAVAITTDNAYLGLASQYWIKDCCSEIEDLMPPKPFDHPLVIRDIVFDENNQPLYDEFGAHKDNLYGDHILVNGQPWPVMHVEPRQYRFRGLVANPSRPYRLEFTDQPGSYFLIIGTDGGFLERAVKTHTLRMHVAERYEMIIDFNQAAFQGVREVILYNQNPYNVPQFCFTHLIMKFIIDLPLTPGLNPAPIREGMFLEIAPLFPQPPGVGPKGPFVMVPSRPLAAPLIQDDWLADAINPAVPARRRIKFHRNGGQWVITTTDLLAGQDVGGGPQTWDSTYNTVNGAPLPVADQWTTKTGFPEHVVADPITNTMEIWEIENGGGGWFHPIHIHLIDFILARRENGDIEQDLADGGEDGLAVYERRAAKDTVFLGPGELLRVVARWGPESGHYMFHCHNIVHEDDDMMLAFFTRGNRLIFDPNNRTFGGLDLPDDPSGLNAVLIEPLSDRSQPLARLPVVNRAFLRGQLARGLYRAFYPPEQAQQGYPINWKAAPYFSRTRFTPPAENPYEVDYVGLDFCPTFAALRPPGFFGV